MAQISGDVWLQTEQSTGAFGCESFSGVPAQQRSWITLISAGSQKGRALAAELGNELKSILRASSPQVTLSTISCPCAPDAMRPENFPTRRKVLVLIGADDKPFTDEAWYSNWQSDVQNAAVMTLLPAGRFDSYFVPSIASNSDHLLSKINACWWKDKIREALPRILDRADVTTNATRLFISYRRLETLPLALQLFDELTHEGFDVFLDRFTIPPGYDFQRRLTQELEDKSMVLLLESRHLKDSKWTQHEIDFAKRNRLGIYTLRMPDVKVEEALTSTRSDDLMTPDASDFNGDPKPAKDDAGKELPDVSEWPALKRTKLSEVVSEVKRAHARSLFQRRHRLRADLVAELQKQGVRADYDAVGPLFAEHGVNNHLIWPTTRPPEVDDFRSTHAAHKARVGLSTDSRALVIGPTAAQEPDRLARLKWLEQVSGCMSYDEGNLKDFVNRLINGRW